MFNKDKEIQSTKDSIARLKRIQSRYKLMQQDKEYTSIVKEEDWEDLDIEIKRLQGKLRELESEGNEL